MLVVITAAIVPSLRAQNPESQRELAAQIFTNWDRQQSELRSGNIRWVETKLVRRGSLNPIGATDNRPHPSEDTLVKYDHQFLFDLGQRWKHAVVGKTWDVTGYQWVETSELCVSDGTKAMHYEQGWDGVAKTAKFTNLKDCICIRGTRLGPITLTIRVFATSLFEGPQFSPSLSNEPASLNGVICDVVTYSPAGSKNVDYRCWISRGPIRKVVKYVSSVAGKELMSIDFQYGEKAEGLGGQIPAGWTTVETQGSGSERLIRKGEVTEVQINPSIPDDVFALRPPKGTLVFDSFSDPRREPMYIVRPDGSLRSLPPQDFGATEEQLFNSEPGRAHSVRSRSFRLLWIVGALSLIAGILIVQRRARRMRHQSS
jgi:hypothetical protein